LTAAQGIDNLIPTIGGENMSSTNTQIRRCGNGLALRLSKPLAKAAGVAYGTRVRVVAKPGRIVIETQIEPTLEEMLAAFDPLRHAGEAM
jgi:antitoxin MazE